MQKLLSTVLNIRPGEGRPLFWLLIHAFFAGLVAVFFDTVASTLFLMNFSAEAIPYAYVGVALVVTIVGWFYSKFEERFSFTQMLVGTLVFLLFTITLFRIGFRFLDPKWPSLLLFVWVEVVAVLLSLELWGLIGRIFNVRQGKRLFALLGAGEISAAVVGGLSIPFILKFIGPLNLLFISAPCVAICLVVLVIILKKFPDKVGDNSDNEEEENAGGLSFKEFFRQRYLVLLLIFTSISMFGYYFIDFAYYDRVEAKYPDEKQLASFLGVFFAISGAINLIFSTFISGRLINRFGLNVGLLGLPIMVGLCVAAMVLGSSFQVPLGIFFFMVIATKLFDDVLRCSLEEPSIFILYQPLPSDQRLKAQTVVESIIEPVSSGLAGGVLILFGILFDLDAMKMAYILPIIIAVWLVGAVLIKRQYPKALEQSLSNRSIDDINFNVHDSSSMKVLTSAIQSERPTEVMFALNVLASLEYDKLDDHLIQLLEYKDESVRLNVLQRIESRNVTAALPGVIAIVQSQVSEKELAAALKTLCCIGDDDTLERVSPFLSNSSPEVRKGAMVGLLRSGGLEGVLAAGEILTSLLRSQQAEDRIFGATVLGEIGIRNFYRPLLHLLNDPDKSVRKEAILASGNLKNEKLWPIISESLHDPDVASAAVLALSRGGESALPSLEELFVRKEAPSAVRNTVLKIMQKTGGKPVVAFLRDKTDYPDERIRQTLLETLQKCRFQVDAGGIAAVIKGIEKEVAIAVRTLAAIALFKSEENCNLLVSALRHEFEQHKERVFSYLAFMNKPELIASAKLNLSSSEDEKKAYAMEIIDNLLSGELKEIILPLIDDLSSEEKLRKLNSRFPHGRPSEKELLQDILSAPRDRISSWTKTCAACLVGLREETDLAGSLEASLEDPNPAVRETAVWAMIRLDPQKGKALAATLAEDAKQGEALYKELLNKKTLGV